VANIASSRGLHLERTPMLNDSPPLIDALASLAQGALEVAI
jgi:protoheme ferro-lyase